MSLNTRRFSNVLCMLCGMAFVPSDKLWAHGFEGSLGRPRSAMDIWMITCGEGTDHLFLEATDIGPNAKPRLSVQILKGTSGINTTDRVANDDNASPQVLLHEGAGVYFVLIDKAGRGTKDYRMTGHCQALGGFHLLTDIVQRQDQ